MSDYFSARDRVEAWLYKENSDPLAASDIQTLLDKLAGPCGSCHPCTEYADETWRAAGRKPPHVYEYDELKALVHHLYDDLAAESLAKALRENGWQKTSHTLTWDNAFEATRRRHTAEARKLIDAVLLRPEQS